MNASGRSEAMMRVRTRIKWLKLRECGELAYKRKFLLKIKERIYQSRLKIGNAILERNTVSEREWKGNYKN